MVLLIFFFLLFHVISNDVKKKKIFNESVVMCFVVGLVFLIFYNSQKISDGWIDSLVSAVLFFLFFLVFYVLGFMGAGDVKFGSALAFCFGVKLFFYVLCISIFISIIYFIVDEGLGRKKSIIFFRGYFVSNRGVLKNMPYGAFLSISAMIVILGVR